MMRTLAAVILAAAALQPQPRLLDLGHPLSVSDPTWSGEPGAFSHTVTSTIEKHGIFTARFTADEHFGTHVDAPAHFAAKGWTVDQIPVDRLIRAGYCIQVTRQAEANED